MTTPGHKRFPLPLPTETKVESGTSQSKWGTSVNSSNSGKIQIQRFELKVFRGTKLYIEVLQRVFPIDALEWLILLRELMPVIPVNLPSPHQEPRESLPKRTSHVAPISLPRSSLSPPSPATTVCAAGLSSLERLILLYELVPVVPVYLPSPRQVKFICYHHMCSGSEAGSYLRLIDVVYHSPLGLRVVKKKREAP